MELIFNVIITILLLWIIRQINQIKGGELEMLRVKEETFDALLTLAEAAVAADAHDKADLQALQATVADEKELDAGRQARIDALVQPSTASSQPAAGTQPS